MSWEILAPEWSDADVDEADVWARSGGEWLTAPGVAVPVRLVKSVAGLTRFLDDRGGGIARLVGANGVGIIGERAAALGLSPSDTTSCGGASRLLACADGWLATSLARAEDIASIPAWLHVDVDDDDPWSVVRRALAHRSMGDVVEQAIALGLACCEVGEVVDSRPVLIEGLGEACSRPLDGLVVANLSSLWAGPLAGDVLARLGARVITVESINRPDGARATPAFFDALHGGCDSVALALDTDTGRIQLRDLLARMDVVIEGSRPRALQQMGIDARSLARQGPQIWLSMTAYGRDLPHGQRIGFGDDAAAAGGLIGWLGGAPVFVADAVADPITGLTVAATIVQLADRGGRWLVDVALARIAASMAPSADDEVAAPLGSPRAPQVRGDPGRPMPLGRDTAAVLAEFGVRP